MKIGSLCTGYGGLDMAVEAYFAAETVWCAEYDKYASQLITERFNYPNYGDIKSINWAQLEPIDILTAGYPCQPFSSAGYRKGTDDERHIFPYILEAISTLRPRWVILENVRGHLSLGLKEVLAGLAKIGYDARWEVVRASDVGAPHQRARLYIAAYPSSAGLQRSRNEVDDLTYGIASDSDSNAHKKLRRTNRSIPDETGEIINRSNRQKHWNRFEITERKVPITLDQADRLNPGFVEYMMGLPKGWVTDLELSRTQQLKMLGNGVVPQQAYYALEQLMKLDTPSEQDLF
jgi:DNA (cytosine-5)-methyltransferase 1